MLPRLIVFIMRRSFDLHESITSPLDMTLNTYSWVGIFFNFIPNQLANFLASLSNEREILQNSFSSVPQLTEIEQSTLKLPTFGKSYLFQSLLHIHSNLTFIDTNLQICTHPSNPRIKIVESVRKNQHEVAKRQLRPCHKPSHLASKLIS